MKLSAWLTTSAVALLAVAHDAPAAVLFEESFQADPTANWTVNDPGLSDTLVNFFYNYAAIGIPAAPNGTGTRGLKMTANNAGGLFSGFSVSPNGQSFAGDYRVTFDLWQNYVGPLGSGGSGSTQLSTFGIGTAGDVAFWAGAPVKESVAFAVTSDGGSAVDYRAYDSSAPTGHPPGSVVFSAPGGAINGDDAYYAGFGGESAPGVSRGRENRQPRQSKRKRLPRGRALLQRSRLRKTPLSRIACHLVSRVPRARGFVGSLCD